MLDKSDIPNAGTGATTIEWGDEIAVNGERLAWLRDDDRFLVIDGRGEWSRPYNDAEVAPRSWGYIHAIRLPADHPYYRATAAGFEYWPGGDEAPADWDGGEVLTRIGKVFSGKKSGFDGVAEDMWPSDGNPYDIIGYRKRAEPKLRAWRDTEDGPVKFAAVTQKDFAFIATIFGQPIYCERKDEVRLRGLLLDGKIPPFDKPANTYDPATHVAVPLMTEDEAREWYGQWFAADFVALGLSLMRRLGLIRPDPTPIERFMAEHRGAHRETAEMVLAWDARLAGRVGL